MTSTKKCWCHRSPECMWAPAAWDTLPIRGNYFATTAADCLWSGAL